jgi:hypothetical protein
VAGRRCRLGTLGERNRRGLFQCSHDVPVPDDVRSDSGHRHLSHDGKTSRVHRNPVG